MRHRYGARPRDDGPVSEACVRALLAGDQDAFATVWRALNPLVLRYARVVAPADADDVASEAWTSVIAALDRFSGGPDELRAWLFTCARRRALDVHRRRARRPTAPLEVVAEPAGGPEPEAVAGDSLATEEAIALLRRLPPDIAEVVALRVVAGMDADQVGALVGRPAGTVRVMTHRGLRRLEQLIAPASIRV